MKIELLCTLGPASMNERVIKRLTDLGVSLFRINLSHTDLAELPSAIDLIQSNTSVPVCLDTEGAQVRNGPLRGGRAILVEHALVHARRLEGPGDSTCFSFYPDFVVDLLEIGDFISIDFNAVLVQVIDRSQDAATMRVINGGVMGQNKAVTVDRQLALKALTGKDRSAIDIGKRSGVLHYALSFANCGADVDLIRSLCGSNSQIISKIECRNGLKNLPDIIKKSDAILIDRGDLSREVPIEEIPTVQRDIIRCCNEAERKVYVATNLLESMIQQPGPTRAEVNDVITTLESGADGLVLAAETAIGVNPIASANMIARLIRTFESKQSRGEEGYDPKDPGSLLVPPHGNRLVDRLMDKGMLGELKGLRRMILDREGLMDCEQIALGTFSPLTGFMDYDTTHAVLTNSRLPNNLAWPMPILLPLNSVTDFEPRVGERLILCDPSGNQRATIDISQLFELDLHSVSKAWFGTSDPAHPGVARLIARGNRFLAGTISLIERSQSLYRPYELTPSQTRSIFAHKGWTRVVGFHTRNPAHRVHEYLQLAALTSTHADGLFISPVIGPTKKGDFLPGPIMQSYQTLIELGTYPEGRVVLGSFSTYSRFAGPREAVFTALCRKNMGCSHFIVGRDHAGVGNFYGPDAFTRYIEQLGDLGIELVKFDATGYDPIRGAYVPASMGGTNSSISGTQVRDAIRNKKPLPDWFMRKEIQKMLIHELESGRPIFS
jgi:pyruvate kinase